MTAAGLAGLSFSTQPGGGAGGTPFATQPVVTLQDAGGNPATGVVSLTLTGGTGGCEPCSATTTRPCRSATPPTFRGCRVDTFGTGYVLTATSGGQTATSHAVRRHRGRHRRAEHRRSAHRRHRRHCVRRRRRDRPPTPVATPPAARSRWRWSPASAPRARSSPARARQPPPPAASPPSSAARSTWPARATACRRRWPGRPPRSPRPTPSTSPSGQRTTSPSGRRRVAAPAGPPGRSSPSSASRTPAATSSSAARPRSTSSLTPGRRHPHLRRRPAPGDERFSVVRGLRRRQDRHVHPHRVRRAASPARPARPSPWRLVPRRSCSSPSSRSGASPARRSARSRRSWSPMPAATRQPATSGAVALALTPGTGIAGASSSCSSAGLTSSLATFAGCSVGRRRWRLHLHRQLRRAARREPAVQRGAGRARSARPGAEGRPGPADLRRSPVRQQPHRRAGLGQHGHRLAAHQRDRPAGGRRRRGPRPDAHLQLGRHGSRRLRSGLELGARPVRDDRRPRHHGHGPRRGRPAAGLHPAQGQHPPGWHRPAPGPR